MELDGVKNSTLGMLGPTLWFEYLLNPSLLEQNLYGSNSNQAADLIVEFLLNSIVPNTSEKNEKFVDLDGDEQKTVEKKSKKSLALKILALKCAAHLNFNFREFENRVPLPLQQTLFLDLIHFACTGKSEVKEHLSMDYEAAHSQEIFALSTYHRWLLWALRSSQIITKPKPILHIPMPGGQGPSYAAPQVVEGLLRTLEVQVEDSVKVLEKILEARRDSSMRMPTINTFVSLTELSNDETQKWDEGHEISLDEFHLQLRYDLAVWFMFTNNYSVAKHHFTQVAALYHKLDGKTSHFCTIEPKKLRGFLLACRVPVVDPFISLKDRLFQAVADDYSGFLDVLQEDNIKREIPIHYRDSAELDLIGAAASGKLTVSKDMVFKVQTLNAIRKVVDHFCVSSKYKIKFADEGPSGISYLIANLEPLIEPGKPEANRRIKEFILELMEGNDVLRKALANSRLCALFKDDELASGSNFFRLSVVDFTAPLDFPKTLSPDIECGEAIRTLIESYAAPEIQTLLLRLANAMPNSTLWNLYSKWEIPIPLQNVIMNIPAGNLRDTSYILIAKARELLNLKEYAKAIDLHKFVEADVRSRSSQIPSFSAGYKVSKLIEWEILLVEIIQVLNDWPKFSKSAEIIDGLSSKCRSCLGALSRGETILPRSEVVEHCSALLLAAADWEFLLGLDIHWNVSVDLASKLAAVCYDIHHNRERPNRKLSRTLWDLVTPAFGPGSSGLQGVKRSATGAQSTQGLRESPVVVLPVSRTLLSKFCDLLCDPLCLNVMMSMLARLHNIVQDESNLEINVDLLHLWPAVLSGANNFHLNTVRETLHALLERALGMFPSNTSWFKMQGDLYFAQGLHSSAMSSYVAAAAESSNYFSQFIPKQVLDDSTVRRMIRCCQLNQSFTQAAILCQFLDDVDYPTAFRCIQERNCNDAMDALYPCIFDITLLEYVIQIHHKRGEFQRKTQAMKVMGTLELNASNNEEIQREAVSSRKAQFFRMLAKQYL